MVFPFSALPTADLVIDAVYEGGTKGNTADDVLGKLIPGAGNQGGFRAVGSWDAPRLYSSMDDADWPDFIDVSLGSRRASMNNLPRNPQSNTPACSPTSATTRSRALISTTLPGAETSCCNRASPSCTTRPTRERKFRHFS
jgi:hypothetical protein